MGAGPASRVNGPLFRAAPLIRATTALRGEQPQPLFRAAARPHGQWGRRDDEALPAGKQDRGTSFPFPLVSPRLVSRSTRPCEIVSPRGGRTRFRHHFTRAAIPVLFAIGRVYSGHGASRVAPCPNGRSKVTEPMMDEGLVVALMRSSTCEGDWDINVIAVNHDNGGKYPEFWSRAIIQEGVLAERQLSWSREDAIDR